MTARHRVFARMWGVAVLTHLAGNWRFGDVWPDFTIIGLVLAIAGLVATAVIVAPRRWMLMVLGAVVPLAVVMESPVLGNHWLLTGFVSAAYFTTAGRWERFEPAARVILLVAYGFAAFAKLNTGFLDPTTSCGLYYVNEILDEVGVGALASTSPFASAAAWGTALFELSIPVLLMIRRTRPLGVLVGIALHGIMSLDPAQHFYAFTSILLALFVLFLDDRFADRFEGIAEQIRPAARSGLFLAVSVLGVAITLANVTPLSATTAWFLTEFSFVWWIPYLGLVFWVALGSIRSIGLDWRLGPAGVVLVALVALNGLSPYLELKTATAWNMYANLVTVDGDSNHLLIRSTLPLRDGHQDMVTIVSSPDPGLQAYADSDYLLPWPSFRTYLADNPASSVTYRRGGELHEVDSAAAHAELVEPVPRWWRWMPLRAVHATTPDKCQVGYLPAL